MAGRRRRRTRRRMEEEQEEVEQEDNETRGVRARVRNIQQCVVQIR